MGLLDIPEVEPTLAEDVQTIRRLFRSTIVTADSQMRTVRQIVVKYGRSAVAAELGGDAIALLSVYNDLKSAIETAKDTVVEDLS